MTIPPLGTSNPHSPSKIDHFPLKTDGRRLVRKRSYPGQRCPCRMGSQTSQLQSSHSQSFLEGAHTEPPVPHKDLTWRMDQARLQEQPDLDVGLDGLATEDPEVRQILYYHK